MRHFLQVFAENKMKKRLKHGSLLEKWLVLFKSMVFMPFHKMRLKRFAKQDKNAKAW